MSVAATSYQSKVITMVCRRSDLRHEILMAQLTMVLCCAHEMMQYGLYLRSAPHSAAALVVPHGDPNTIKDVLANLEKEWATVEKMERTVGGSASTSTADTCSIRATGKS